MKSLIQLSLIIGWATVARAQTETADFAVVDLRSLTNTFLTADDFRENGRGMQVAYINPQKLTDALKSDESKPEKLDPKGNWGTASEGFRLSLRFPKNQYVQGEPIIATLLARNISQDELLFPFLGTDWETHFLAYDEKNRRIAEKLPEPGTILGHKFLPVYAHTQRRFYLRVDPRLDLQPGSYSLAIQMRVPTQKGNRLVDIVSGTANIIVLAPAEGATKAGLTNLNDPLRK